MREGRIISVIPCRKGSQRVKNKNIRKFSDTTLIENKIKQMIRIPEIDKIILTTDCEKCMEIGKKYGIDIIVRDKYHASSECNNSDFFRNIAETVDEDNCFLMYTPVTSPFVKDETIREVIKIFRENEEYDSVVPMEKMRHHMWMNGRPLNYELDKAPNTQDLPDILALNYSCSIISKKHQIEYSNLCGKIGRAHV